METKGHLVNITHMTKLEKVREVLTAVREKHGGLHPGSWFWICWVGWGYYQKDKEQRK